MHKGWKARQPAAISPLTIQYRRAGWFLAGVLSFLSPCVLPLVPSYLTFVTGMSLDDVQRDKLNKLQTVEEPWQYINADTVWPSLGGLPNAGSNITVADLDTGIWPENPMLADNGTIPAPVNGPYACEFGDGVNPLYGPAFSCNDKLVGAHVDLATYLAVIGAAPGEFCVAAGGPCSARDSERGR